MIEKVVFFGGGWPPPPPPHTQRECESGGGRGRLPGRKRRYVSRDMGWLRLVGCLKIQVSLQNTGLFCRALLQKRPIILSILLIAATPYQTFCELTTNFPVEFVESIIWIAVQSCWDVYEYDYVYVHVYVYV